MKRFYLLLFLISMLVLSLLLGSCDTDTTDPAMSGNESAESGTEPHSHTLGEWTETKAASCQETGLRMRSCAACAYSETEEIPAIGQHVFGAWTTDTEPTCVDSGSQSRVCTRCARKEIQPVSATGVHTFGEWETKTPATCGDAGVKERKCTNPKCNLPQTQSISPTGDHSFGAWTLADTAICGERNKREIQICGVCEFAQARFEDAPDRHSYNEQNICTRCNSEYKDIGLVYAVTNDGYAIWGYRGSASTVHIPDQYMGVPVTRIGSYAFENCTVLRKLTMPNSVVKIDKNAFANCTNLTEIELSSGLTRIESYAFASCKSLKKVHIRDLKQYCEVSMGIETSSPFSYKANLYIDGKQVYDLVIPEGVTSVGQCTFYGCRIRTLVLPETVISIGSLAFRDCALTSVTLPQSLDSIGAMAFSYNSGLKTFYYKGTSAEWEEVDKGPRWDLDTDMGYAITYKVHCSDQTLTFEKDLIF